MASFFNKLLTRYPRLNEGFEQFKKITLPGFDEVPLYDVLVFLRNEFKRDVISVRARAIAFTFFLSLFPALIFLFTLIPYIPVDNLQQNLVNLIRDLLPQDAFLMVEETVTGVIQQQRGDLLSISLLFSLLLSTSGVLAMMDSFDKSYAVFVKRSKFKTRWMAFKLTLLIFFLLVISIITIITGNNVLRLLLLNFNILNPFYFLLFSGLKWIIIILLFFVTISVIYYYGPAVKKKFRFASAGSTLATFLVILISIGFSYFVNNFGRYNEFYGSIGAIIALQIYIYLNALALLLGFELNASIAISKNIRKHHPAQMLHGGDV